VSVDEIALIRRAARQVVNAQADHAQGAAREAAPEDTGALRASIDVARARGRDMAASIYTDLEYAGYVHEDLDDDHPGGGGPKFFETPFTSGAGRAKLADVAAKAAAKALGG